MTYLSSASTMLYQITHPWHWLTYGQNAAAVGLIVLVFYTIYTRRMMLIAQQTRRSELYPLLILQAQEVQCGHLRLLIVNVGGGPLLNVFNWGQSVSEGFILGEAFVERPEGVQPTFAGTLVIQATLTFNSNISESAAQMLMVVEGADNIGGRHQFCVLIRCKGHDNYEYQVRMTHPTEFLPAWRRAMLKVFEWQARVKRKLSKSS